MSRLGHVIETRGDHATISTSRRGICDGCSEKSSCSFESALGKDTPEEVLALNPVNARVGDHVEFDLPGHTELKVSLVVWGVPVAGLIAGAAAGSNLGLPLSEDLATLLGAVAGSVLAYLAVMLYDRRAARDSRLKPRILKIVKHCEK
jgi:sigma-E factor negative regulatory protein RseC